MHALGEGAAEQADPRCRLLLGVANGPTVCPGFSQIYSAPIKLTGVCSCALGLASHSWGCG